MKKTTYILTLFFLFQMANAQIHEFGIFAGGSNFIGDVGKTNYIAPNQPAFGILYKWNRNPRYSWRFSAMMSKVKAFDSQSDLISRKERALGFGNTITEFSGGFEFNFFDFNLHEPGFFSTPYIYTGLSYFTSDKLYVIGGKYYNEGKGGHLALPIIGGLKMKIADNFVLGLEAGARYTFTDDIDGSLPKNGNFDSLKFGNINSNDWYVFTGVTLTYTFGNKPCYCKE
ncbi:type IX secretion system protein PorG [Flavobacterium humi]|uniref:DUF6089 domain-containing protein n=1 Tax=Flavobacterium humi TaxID=2562683 RepID=A0A4Z0L7V1_9FLAO|nr:DUF6089 family protein [Flavobacterium humi]TGD57241.1 hypothetical protein E4635_11500 [Flavobacterium humi]